MEIREYTQYKAEEVLPLYAAVGWTAYTRDPEAMARGFRNSLLVLGAYEGEKLLGLVRAVGDVGNIVFVQDILVYAEHQRRGIGRALMEAVLDRYAAVRQIQLTTDDTPRTLAFYRSLGFREYSELGCRGFLHV